MVQKSTRPYKRILLKLSGESLMGDQDFGISPALCQQLAEALVSLQKQNFEIAVVIGGGNIFRGKPLEKAGMQRSIADQLGMLATLMNGVALQQALISLGCPSKVMSALDCPKIVDSYNWQTAMDLLAKGTLLIFVGGTGNPYFTTDSAAALRACEIHADLLIKATKVDGIYNKDPIKYSDAIKYDCLTFSQVLSEELEVMDATAIALCRSNQLPIFVFDMDLLLQCPSQFTTILKKRQGTFVEEK